MRDQGVFIISVAAELSGVHPQTLRTYERKGLIKPARTSGGTRRYSERDVNRVRLIQELTQGVGVNLAGVERILAMQDRIDELEDQLEDALREIEETREEARRAIREARRASRHEIVVYQPPEIVRHRSSRR